MGHTKTQWERLHKKIHAAATQHNDAPTYAVIAERLDLPPEAGDDLKKYILKNFGSLSGLINAHISTVTEARQKEADEQTKAAGLQMMFDQAAELTKEQMLRAYIGDEAYDDICDKAKVAANNVFGLVNLKVKID